MDALLALSPLDGRYAQYGSQLTPYFSEYALVEHRITTMLEWVRFMSRHPGIPLRTLSGLEEALLDNILDDFNLEAAQIIKDIETKGYGGIKATRHDVKACELYLRMRFDEVGLGDIVEWIHLGRTSEDVNNIAYALMLKGALDEVIMPALRKVVGKIRSFATTYAALPMLARTHGQPASPTTLGKEFAVFATRLERQLDQLASHTISIKSNGASGNHCAEYAALPGVDWLQVSQDFCEHISIKLARGQHFRISLVTTQIEPHDTYAELFGIVQRVNTIFIGLCQDVWRYISDDWLVQKTIDGEVGSSAMPHKVNPIDWENAEGNLGMANALLGFFCAKLSVSRLQRDLSDSTVERNFGVMLGYCLIAYASMLRGMDKISPNEEKIRAALRDHPEAIVEAYQTILRMAGYPNPYNVLKELTRGRAVTIEELQAFVRQLDVDDAIKTQMLAITPETYIGLAAKLAMLQSS